jgi:hypothetical protein
MLFVVTTAPAATIATVKLVMGTAQQSAMCTLVSPMFQLVLAKCE